MIYCCISDLSCPYSAGSASAPQIKMHGRDIADKVKLCVQNPCYILTLGVHPAPAQVIFLSVLSMDAVLQQAMHKGTGEAAQMWGKN